jgi:hypothetical protein
MAIIASLPEWGLIRASGPDSQAFLHGQLTNDLLHLAPEAAQWSGYCTAKGRMLAGFLVWRDAADGYYLATDRALAGALAKRLSMYVLRAKVKIEDVSARFAAFGLIDGSGPAPFATSAQGEAWLVGLPAVDGRERMLAWVPADAAAAYASGAGHATADASDWMRLMVRAGEAWITTATQEQFVPQMINFDAMGGISFKKGCYPGQEIVARAHYRGAVKRRMYRATVAVSAKAGDALFASDLSGQESGMVALAAPDGKGGSELLAVLQIRSHGEAEVRLGTPDGPLLHFEPLPYALPDAA